MLDWIARLRALPDDRHVYGLTSHYRLCLLSQDTYASPWYLIITASDERNYYVALQRQGCAVGRNECLSFTL